MPLDINQIKSFQTGSIQITQSTTTVIPGISAVTGSGSLQKTIESISKLSSKSNEITSFLNDASIAGGNQPFNISTFAREFVLKSNESNKETTDKVTDSKPITRKSQQITKRVVDTIVQNYIKSNKLLNILETNINKILAQSNINYVSVENGQIVAQPIQNQQVDQAIKNIQQVINTYIEAVNKYARRIYNTDPIRTTNDIKNNLSLNKLVELLEKIIAVALLILQTKIKIRKARDLSVAANAAAQLPVPNLALAAEYTERATQFTSTEQNQLDDLAAAQEVITEVKKKINFYGKKYEQSKNKLLDLQGIINSYQQQVLNKALQPLNNQLTGSYNQLTGSLETKISNITGSI